jgi:hypothetical protein
MHDAMERRIVERLDGMHRAAIVPHDDIVIRPGVAVHVPFRSGASDQFVEQRTAFGRRHALDHGVR